MKRFLPPSPFPPTPRLPYWPKDGVLVRFEDVNGGGVDLTHRDSERHIYIQGEVGSGKTTGSGETLLRSFMAARMGGLILTVKPSDRQFVMRLAAEEGRLHQLCCFGPGEKYRLKLFDYMANHPDAEMRSAANFAPFIEAVSSASMPNNDGSADTFWQGNLRRLTSNLVRILGNSGKPFTMADAREFLSHAPKSAEAAHAGYWKATPFGRWLSAASVHTVGTPQDKEVAGAIQWWLKVFPSEPDVSRGGVLMSFEAMAEVFNDPILKDLFESGETNLVPEHVLDGGVILIDLPLLKYPVIGRVAAAVWRLLVQAAIERRTDRNDATRMPVFIWCDELQFHVDPKLNLWLSTAREARGVFVGLTQNIPALYSGIGGKTPEHSANALLSSFGTKIFHAQTDPTSCKFASDQIGNTRRWRASGNKNRPAAFSFKEGGDGVNIGSESEPFIRPEDFQKLRAGGPLNGGCIDGIALLGVKAIEATGRPYLEVVFQQSGDFSPPIASTKPASVRGLLHWLFRVLTRG
jgi:hypothetical protein